MDQTLCKLTVHLSIVHLTSYNNDFIVSSYLQYEIICDHLDQNNRMFAMIVNNFFLGGMRVIGYDDSDGLGRRNRSCEWKLKNFYKTIRDYFLHFSTKKEEFPETVIALFWIRSRWYNEHSEGGRNFESLTPSPPSLLAVFWRLNKRSSIGSVTECIISTFSLCALERQSMRCFRIGSNRVISTRTIIALSIW